MVIRVKVQVCLVRAMIIQRNLTGSAERNYVPRLNSCVTNEFWCTHVTTGINHFILSSRICNGIRDCGDDYDEMVTVCHNAFCALDSLWCQYGGCRSVSMQCDGFRDCIDGPDETWMLCLAHQCPKCRQSRIDTACEHNNEMVSCTDPIRPGTTVMYD